MSRWRLRRTRHQRVCILNGVLVLKGQPGQYAAMACGGRNEHCGETDSTPYALPILNCALDATLWAHVTHPGRLARVASQEKVSAMTNRVHVFGYAGDGTTRGG